MTVRVDNQLDALF